MTDMGLWQEYISSLSDEKFFYIMRLYLGEIKTPYNKLRLIEQLASFLKNTENTKNIISFLDETDLKILTAVKIIPTLTQGKLISFFSDEYSFPELYSKISNLTERLLIFKTKSPNEFFRINPLLENEIDPYLNTELILPRPVLAESSFETPFVLSPNFIASFISYIRINGISLKADGTFKKSDLTALEKIYGEKLTCLQYILNAFINLGFARDDGKKINLDEERASTFCELSEFKQYVYLCIASKIRLSRDVLKSQAQILADCLASIPEEGFTKKTFIRLAQIVSNKKSSDSDDNLSGRKSLSRFSQMLQQAKSELEGKESCGGDSTNIIEAVFETCVEFGLLYVRGETESGEYIYIAHDFGENNFGEKSETKIEPKVLNINATSSVVLLPGLPLKKLLPLTSFLQIVSSSTVTEFEITRKSVSRAFDCGCTLDEIKKLLSKYATFELPQNLLINLEEWHNTYSSAMLYKGYVLKVSKDNIARTENNPNIAPFIKEKLAEGIYLLDIPVDEDSSFFVKASGLEFLGSIKSVDKEEQPYTLPIFSEGHRFTFENKSDTTKNPECDAEKIKAGFFEKLEKLDIEKHQKESLHSRIENNLIVSESQLVASSVRTEIIEADGIDFHGKIHLVEASIKDEDMLEITMPSPDGSGGTFSIFGKPLSLIKHEGEAIMRFQIEPTLEQNSFLVSKISHIKRIRK